LSLTVAVVKASIYVYRRLQDRSLCQHTRMATLLVTELVKLQSYASVQTTLCKVMLKHLHQGF